MTTATTGTGTLTLGSAVSGFLSFAGAGVSDGEIIGYAISDGSNSEIGRGTYTSSGTTLSRTVLKSTNSDSAISLTGSAQVMITPSAQDFLREVNAQTGTTYTVLQSDLGKLVTHSNASSIAVTLPQATGMFAAGWYYHTVNKGAGTVTITPTTSTINGASTLTLITNQAALIVSDGTNYQVAYRSHVDTITAAIQAGTIELGHATDTTLSRSAAGELAVEGVVVKKVGKETIWVPATAMIARTTNGAGAGTVEMTTNKNMFKTLDFDTTTQEFAQFFIRMPKSWNESTVTAAFTWSHPSTTTNFGVVWALEGVATSDDDAGDVAFGTAQQVADTGGTTNDVYITSATSAITIAGTPAAEDLIMFQVKRVPSDGSDTMAVDARLHGVTLYITTDASTDA